MSNVIEQVDSRENPIIYFSTTGCVSLRLDLSEIRSHIGDIGYTITSDIEESSIVIFAPCVVTDEQYRADLEKIRYFKSKNKLVMLCGCGATSMGSSFDGADMIFESFSDIKNYFKVNYIKNVDSLPKSPTLSMNNRSIEFDYYPSYLKNDISTYSTFVSVLRRVDESLATRFVYSTAGLEHIGLLEEPYMISVSKGCDYRCSYCLVWKARGPYQSRSVFEITSEIRTQYTKGRRRFELIADEISSYGHDGGEENLKSLIDKIFREFPEIVILFRYLEPMRLSKYIDDIRMYFVDERVQYLNIPLQFGTQKLLDAVNRPCNILDSISSIKKIRSAYSGPMQSHVIFGYHKETIEDVVEMRRILIDCEFDDISIHRFSPRPGTSEEKSNIHIDFLAHQEVLEKTKRQLRTASLKRIVSSYNNDTRTPRNKNSTVDLEREYRFSRASLSETTLEMLKGLYFQDLGDQIDIVYMNQDDRTFVARVRSSSGLHLQFKYKIEDNVWSELSTNIDASEVASVCAVLSEFMVPVSVVKKRRKVCQWTEKVRIYMDDVMHIGGYIEVEGFDQAVEDCILKLDIDKEKAGPPYGRILDQLNLDIEAEIKEAFREMA